METTQTRHGIPVTLMMAERPQGTTVAFISKNKLLEERTEMARLLASSFLKYCQPATTPAEAVAETVEEALRLHQLFVALCQQAEDFLADALLQAELPSKTLPALAEDGMLNDFLLRFASHRLTQASRAYYFKSLAGTGNPQTAATTTVAVATQTEINQLRSQVSQYQQDFDNLIQAL